MLEIAFLETIIIHPVSFVFGCVVTGCPESAMKFAANHRILCKSLGLCNSHLLNNRQQMCGYFLTCRDMHFIIDTGDSSDDHSSSDEEGAIILITKLCQIT